MIFHTHAVGVVATGTQHLYSTYGMVVKNQLMLQKTGGN